MSQNDIGKSYAWLVWSLAAISFGYAFFHRVTPSVMVSDLMAEFAVSGAVLGTLSALYFYPYVLLQVPLGAMLETFGTRILLSVCLLLAGVGSILFGLAHSVEVAYLGRFLIGFGSSVGFLGSLALASKWFPPHRFAFLAGLSMFVAMTSGMVAQAPLAYLIDIYGWRANILALGTAGFALSLLVFLFVRNQPASLGPAGARPLANREKWRELGSALKAVTRNADVWKVSLVAATMSGPMLVIGGLWGTPFLMVKFDLSRPEAAFFMSLLLLGWAVGAPVSGWLSDYIGRRKPILVTGLVLICIMLAIVTGLEDLPLGVVVACFVMVGMSGGGMTASFGLVKDVMPASLAGAATGVVNSMTVASGAILQPFVGLALDLQWDGGLVNGARHYAEGDFRMAFTLVLAAAVIGLVTAVTLRDAPAG
ncbi:MAG: MFS transporter [Pseudomonadota bacterium]|nr:MFS transporter [Pseudomonadota bacterium]